jgi:drug/metabolite transporter (DMT)-like permease
MWRLDLTDVFGMLTGIILGLGFFALIAFLVYLFVYKRIQMRHQMRLELIKQGKEIPVEVERYGSLKAGIILTGIGLGLLLALWFEASYHRGYVGAEIMLGLIPMFVGIGLIIFHFIARHGNNGVYLHSSSSESLES